MARHLIVGPSFTTSESVYASSVWNPPQNLDQNLDSLDPSLQTEVSEEIRAFYAIAASGMQPQFNASEPHVNLRIHGLSHPFGNNRRSQAVY